MGLSKIGIDRKGCKFYFEYAAGLTHRMHGIRSKIHNDLMNSSVVAQHQRRLRIDLASYLDRRGKRSTQQGQRIVEDKFAVERSLALMSNGRIASRVRGRGTTLK